MFCLNYPPRKMHLDLRISTGRKQYTLNVINNHPAGEANYDHPYYQPYQPYYDQPHIAWLALLHFW
jgi:hypothetical protein